MLTRAGYVCAVHADEDPGKPWRVVVKLFNPNPNSTKEHFVVFETSELHELPIVGSRVKINVEGAVPVQPLAIAHEEVPF